MKSINKASVASISIFGLFIVILFYSFRYGFNYGCIRFDVISGESMKPLIWNNDTVVSVPIRKRLTIGSIYLVRPNTAHAKGLYCKKLAGVNDKVCEFISINRGITGCIDFTAHKREVISKVVIIAPMHSLLGSQTNARAEPSVSPAELDKKQKQCLEQWIISQDAEEAQGSLEYLKALNACHLLKENLNFHQFMIIVKGVRVKLQRQQNADEFEQIKSKAKRRIDIVVIEGNDPCISRNNNSTKPVSDEPVSENATTTFRLAKPTRISWYSFECSSNCTNGMSLMLSADGKVWRKIFAEGNVNTTREEGMAIPPMFARYLRVIVTSQTSGNGKPGFTKVSNMDLYAE